MEKQIEYICPCCGHDTEQLTEGYCLGCFQDRQLALDMFNAEYDYWHSLTDAEKEDRIKWSSQ